MRIACNRLLSAALSVVFACAGASAFAAGGYVLKADFSADELGREPTSASSVRGGPSRPVLVVGESTDPPDPFRRPGNRSLMLQNSERSTSPVVRFDARDRLVRGSFSVEFFLDISYAAEDGGHDFHRSEIRVGLGEGGENGIWLRRIRSNRFLAFENGEEIHLANRPEVNQRNFLLIHFDAEAGTYSGSLNGEPLESGGRTEFAFNAEVGGISQVTLDAGHNGMAGSRVFVDSVALAAPGVIGKDDLLARMPTYNILADSSFEGAPEAREFYPLIGEYRHPGEGQWEIDATEAWHGRQSLKMTGPAPYFWQVMEQVEDEWVFSVYLKGSEPGQRVELGTEKHEYGNEAGIWLRGHRTETVEVGPEWQRFVLASQQDDAEARGNPSSMGRCQYRAWVRPLDGAVLWVDAAQLELGGQDATEYDPVRRGSEPETFIQRMLAGPIVDPDGPTTELEIPEGARSKQGEIALAVREASGAARCSAPVWGGVPFPEGELYDANAVRLTGAEGREVPVQTKVLARWPRDASIRSLLVDFQADVPAGGASPYTLHYGGDPAEAGRALASDDGEQVVIETGEAALTIRRDAFRWFEAEGLADAGEAPPGSFVVDMDGAVFSSAWGAPDEVVIETNGPQRAVVAVHGRHWTEDGERSLLNYEARIHAFAGSAMLLVEHTFENREPEVNTAIRAHYLRLPVADGGARAARFGVKGGPAFEAGVTPGQPATLTQVKDYFGEGRYLLIREGAGEAETQEHARAAGWLQAGSASVSVEDFWQLHPKALRAEPGALVAYHWPERHVRFADLSWGLSSTLRLAYAPFGADVSEAENGEAVLAAPNGATLSASALLLQPEARWVAESGVFGRYLTSEEAKEKYPGFESRVGRYFDLLAVDRKVTGHTGMLDYGCVGDMQGWLNNETTIARNMWWQYLRTWDPAQHRRAWIKTRHFRDVDILHGGPGSRVICHHAGGYHTSTQHHTGHYWITGVIWHYLLTGDMRSYRVAVDSGANLITRGLGDRTTRNRARPLYHLAELYKLSQLEQFREGFEHTYTFVREGTRGGPLPVRSSRDGGKELMALARWHRITGEQRFYDHWLEGVEAHWQHHLGGDRYTGGGRDTRLFNALAEAALETGDPKFVSGVYDLFISYLVGLISFDHNIVRSGSSFLYAADRLGVPTPETMPDHTLDMVPLTGWSAPEPLLVRVAPEAGKPLVLKVYFTRDRNRRENDAVLYRVENPAGARVKEGAIRVAEGRARGDTHVLRLPPLPEGGEYRVTLEFEGDGQAEISSSSPHLFLDASTAFNHRRDGYRTRLFGSAFRAPREQPQIAFSFQWRDRIWQNRGQALAVMVFDEDGRPAAHGRWVVPAGTVYDADGRRLQDGAVAEAFLLDIPEHLRGEILTFAMYPVKWATWQIYGLEDTRLAPARESFGKD